VVLSLRPLRPGSGDPPGWTPVRKRRRISRFSSASQQIVTGGPELRAQPECTVELTEVRTRGQHWWTLGFEATGPASLLRSELQAAAPRVSRPIVTKYTSPPKYRRTQSFVHAQAAGGTRTG
jgi:hypothetical protein